MSSTRVAGALSGTSSAPHVHHARPAARGGKPRGAPLPRARTAIEAGRVEVARLHRRPLRIGGDHEGAPGRLSHSDQEPLVPLRICPQLRRLSGSGRGLIGDRRDGFRAPRAGGGGSRAESVEPHEERLSPAIHRPRATPARETMAAGSTSACIGFKVWSTTSGRSAITTPKSRAASKRRAHALAHRHSQRVGNLVGEGAIDG